MEPEVLDNMINNSIQDWQTINKPFVIAFIIYILVVRFCTYITGFTSLAKFSHILSFLGLARY